MTATLAPPAPGLAVPAVDPTFVVVPPTQRLLDSVEALSRAAPQAVQVRGKQGSGKTTLLEQWAARTGRPYAKIDCGPLETPQDLFGTRNVVNLATTFTPALFLQAIETPRCLLACDELNRCPPEVLGLLYPLLDDTRRTWVPHLDRWVTVADGVIVGAAFNVGAEFAGTHRLDAALASRLATTVEVDWLPEDAEAGVLIARRRLSPLTATRLVKFATELRRRAALPLDNAERLPHAPGLRELLTAAGHIATGGLTPGEALAATILPGYRPGPDGERARVALVLQGLFGEQPLAVAPASGADATVVGVAGDPDDLDDVPFR